MKKVVTIDSCSKCPHLDNEYPDYACTCDKLDKNVSRDINYVSEIHPECPLSDEPTCGFCDKPCGNDWCVTKQKD